MTHTCQPADHHFAIAVAGVAGSGKTTLGWSIAKSLSAALIDLDSVTNPLLEALPEAALAGHWWSSPYGRQIRDGRYAALRATAHDAVTATGRAVLVAPFTSELTGGAEWQALREAVAPAALTMVQLVGDPELFAARRSRRAEPRDQHRRPDSPLPATGSIPLTRIDAELTTGQQLDRLWPRLGLRFPLDPSNQLFQSTFDAILFDLDGTLVDSTASVARSWRRLTSELGVPTDALHDYHGQPARRLMERMLLPDQVDAGIRRITELEVADADTVTPVLGASEIFTSLPDSRRAIVASGFASVAEARLRAAGIDRPEVVVTGEDVVRGKPAPDPYLLAARQLGADPRRCLVVEDASAGIRSAQRAGCRTLAITGTEPRDALTGADLITDGLDRVAAIQIGDDVGLALR